ncbi:zinc finger protein 184-like [Ochlerotatus camptorhynchus]|uniref:zinc finger protein 184-like n=1 Tax=Ochlerotatus camptorhynchus TaxID=644619 RepID=UPI0031D64C9B
MHTDVIEMKEERSIELTCRLCLTEREHYQPIFEDTSPSMVEWIRDLTSLEVVQIPNTPASLCLECVGILKNFESFRATCLSNDKLFVELFLQKEIVEILDNPEENEAQTREKECLEKEIEDIHEGNQEQILRYENHNIAIDIVEHDAQTDEPDEYEVYNLDTATESNRDGTNKVRKPKKCMSQLEPVAADGISKKLCTICNKFVNRLTQHQLIHNEIRPFQCEYCSKGFNQMCNLKKHIRMHTKEKPYLCSWCDKGFTNSTELKVHTRSHTQEKPFKCKDCGKSFVTSGHLVRHARSHSGLKPYSCDVCQAKFSTSSHLVRHKRLHSMEYPYSCSVCDERFMRTEYLKAHRCKLLKNHVRK